jgi:hypothetical protein
MCMKTGVVKTCPQCGVEFRRPPSQAGTKFCGAACWQAHRAAKEKICQHCGKAYRADGDGPNRGTGDKYCSRECAGLSKRRRMEFRCCDCGRVELRRPSLAQRYLRCAACGAAHRVERQKGKPLPCMGDPASREKWLKALQSPEHRERQSEILSGRVKQTELTRRGSPRHAMALHFRVRSPAGVTYQVDNLSEFVRSNPGLFDPEDVVNRYQKPASYASRATNGLRKLRAVVGTRLSWKGWTLALGCDDELWRRPPTAVEFGGVSEDNHQYKEAV